MMGPKKQDFCNVVTRFQGFHLIFLKWRSMGPQKLATVIGHKYSIAQSIKKLKGFNHKNKANY